MNGFERVSYKVKEYKFDFTGDKEDVAVNAVRFVETDIAASVTPLRFYKADGRIFAYCSGGALVEFISGSAVATGFTSQTPPLVIPLTVSGTRTVLFVGGSSAMMNGNAVTGVPYGNSFAFCGGRLFIANGRKVYYSAELNYTDFRTGTGYGGFVETEAEDGDVIYIARISNKLIILCERAVYELSPYGESYEFTLKRVCALGAIAAANSACKAGDGLCFSGEGSFFLFSGDKVKLIGTDLKRYDISEMKAATFDDGLYLLPFVSGGKNLVYVYDAACGKTAVISAGRFTPVGAFGYADGETYFYRAAKPENGFAAGGFNGEFDFGTCRKKAVCGIEAHISGSGEIEVNGEGSYRATLTEKCNAVSCFVHGRSFKIAFVNASADFRIYGLTVKYVIFGG